ncbi:conserved protein of unknown function [Tenacibaculum sp. 190524A02b]|uniref:DUF7222 domain-containing protein n=1 Tax=Tenacibaculum vairaonense TaxID=3137860 RepID=UPI0032B1FC36
MNASQNKSLVKKLQEIANSNANSIRNFVAKEILTCHQDEDEIQYFFEGLFQHGCVSGWVYSLTYYSQTHKFYNEYYNEIECLRLDYEDSIGHPLTIKGDLKNFLAWFAFEETAYQLANELGLEI